MNGTIRIAGAAVVAAGVAAPGALRTEDAAARSDHVEASGARAYPLGGQAPQRLPGMSLSRHDKEKIQGLSD
jgi:hypothetical protein